ncbi:MAG: 2,3,4,5-tetrahydropyridine-2,6-dicarboxylate N-succinyltransferase [Magnetococcales bacterium]|nr:2,3,4,5-tetrahydropyridine-2,6-dicarboxylate N-succinyltransferase [Magnetococcales bacterium]
MEQSTRASLQQAIEEIWQQRELIQPVAGDAAYRIVTEVITALDGGHLRVAEPQPDHPEAIHGWVVNQWLKKAILLHFKFGHMQVSQAGVHQYYDKVSLKFSDWQPQQFEASGIRVVPPAAVRRGAYIAPGVVLMPSYTNIGAYVDSGTMVDTWATVGSCAQIGRRVHLSGGTGIGGVLEPLQANPVIIEDDCFIGARAEVAEGVVVKTGSVLAMGVYLGASTPIVDRATGQVYRGYVPPYSVVVSGTLPGKPLPDGQPGPNLYCAVIVKQVDAQTRAKTAINQLLRDF